MKISKIINVLSIIILLSLSIKAHQTNPVVTEVAFSILGTTVTVNYKVADAEQTTVTISMEVSEDGGSTWGYNYGTTGIGSAIGDGISVGTDLKTITWTYDGGSSSNNFRIKIIADDKVGDQIYYAGQVYNTVRIGSRTWLKENLNVGTMINGAVNQTNNSILEKYCYNDLESNCNTYGGFYQWSEALQYVTTEGAKGICPLGWHIPANAEFQTLKSSVFSDGNALKSIGQGTGGGVGTNTSGFSALLSGHRHYNGSFYNLGYYANFWSSSEYNSTYASTMSLNYNDSYINLNLTTKEIGFNVRCVRD